MEQHSTINISLTEAVYGNKKIVFNKPIEFSVKKDSDCYYSDIDVCDIHSAAESLEDLLIEIQKEFIFLWGSYACEEDENMTKGAIEMKQWLLENAKKV